eukprot:gene17424-22976_t
MEETTKKPKSRKIIDRVSRKFTGVDWDRFFKHLLPDSPWVEIADMPYIWMYFLFICFYGGMLSVLGYFLYSQYELNRTQTFISLQNNAGVCDNQPSLGTCCEVPLTVTGDYLADTNGYWSTEPQFSYVNSAYGVTLAGVTYSNQQWTQIMNNVVNQVEVIGRKGKKRDLAWNLVSWDSYSAEDRSYGYFRFYSSGDAGITYNKHIYDIVYGAKDENCAYFYDWTAAFNPTTASLDITVNLNFSFPYEPYYSCPYDKNTGTSACYNYCPETFSFKQFGYDPSASSRPVPPAIALSLDMNAISTSMAINYNMMTLDHLVNVKNDQNRINLLSQMNSSKYITQDLINSTSSYYDTLNAPTDPIYCTTFNDPTITVPACFVRIGNILAYAVTTSWGYYANKNSQYPKQCKYPSNSTQEKYYCNLFDVVVALIYYPNPCDDISITTANYTYRRRLQETYEQDPYFDLEGMVNKFAMQDSPTEFPTDFPTEIPTTSPSEFPTQLPTENPTFAPSDSPSAAAKAISLDKINGDMKVPEASYDALISLLSYNYSNPSAFNAICPGRKDKNGMFIPAGCAAIAIEFYGGAEKEISEYYYQPDLNNNQFTAYSVLNKLANNPPTSLIQQYYSCVLGVKDSFIQATGIAFSNATLYVGLGFIGLVFLIKFYLNHIERRGIKSPLLKEVAEEEEEDRERERLEFELKELKDFKNDMIDILSALKSDPGQKSSVTLKNFTKVLNSKNLAKTERIIDIKDNEESHQEHKRQSGDIELTDIFPVEIIQQQEQDDIINKKKRRSKHVEKTPPPEEVKSDDNSFLACNQS